MPANGVWLFLSTIVPDTLASLWAHPVAVNSSNQQKAVSLNGTDIQYIVFWKWWCSIEGIGFVEGSTTPGHKKLKGGDVISEGIKTFSVSIDKLMSATP
jgi:hypothetical protein